MTIFHIKYSTMFVKNLGDISILERKLLNQGMNITAQQVGNLATQLWCGMHLAPASRQTTIQSPPISFIVRLFYNYNGIVVIHYITVFAYKQAFLSMKHYSISFVARNKLRVFTELLVTTS